MSLTATKTNLMQPDAAPALTEARLGQECGTWLNRHHRDAYAHFAHVPNGGLRTSREATALKSQHVSPGYPDYLLDLPRGGYHGLRIELKTPTGRVAPEQADWLARLTAAGFRCAVIRSLPAFIELLTDYLAA